MKAKNVIVLVGVFCFVLVLTVRLIAQRQSPQTASEPQHVDVATNLMAVQTQLTAITSALQNGDKDIGMKLDQILSNQQKILDELEIVKVRASQHR